jgi:hypothetical protein
MQRRRTKKGGADQVMGGDLYSRRKILKAFGGGVSDKCYELDALKGLAHSL